MQTKAFRDPTTFRRYMPADLARVGEFLVSCYLPENADGNWIGPAWGYMHSHPNLDQSSLDRIGIWEAAGMIVGVAHYESRLGEAFFQLRPGFSALRAEMLEHAERDLSRVADDGERVLRAYINDFDHEFEELAASHGYHAAADESRPVSALAVPDALPAARLPAGFTLKSLADDNNLEKVHRVLWRGFDHPGEPPAEGLAWRKQMQSSPNFRKDLTIVVQAESGDFAAFCGMWYEGQNRLAYIEPLATDPGYRRMGLARAAMWEGIRRCQALGARVVYVGSEDDIYRSVGFSRKYLSRPWVKKVTA